MYFTVFQIRMKNTVGKTPPYRASLDRDQSQSVRLQQELSPSADKAAALEGRGITADVTICYGVSPNT